MGYISRNRACVKIGQALYGEPRSLSGAKLRELVEKGHIIEKSYPSIGGKLQKHVIDEPSVDRFVAELRRRMRAEDAEDGAPKLSVAAAH